jgi:hypothetical protein
VLPCCCSVADHAAVPQCRCPSVLLSRCVAMFPAD